LAELADIQARDTAPLTCINVHDGVRELFWPSSGSVFITSSLRLSTWRRWLGRSLTGGESSGTGVRMPLTQGDWLKRTVLVVGVLASSGVAPVSAHAIVVFPTAEEVQVALDQGKEAAQRQSPPEMFYIRFGVADELHANGFLITKLGGLSVMATHMALRGIQPSQTDVTHILENQTMLVSITIFGNVPSFAVDSYMVFDQSGKTIKPTTVRFDGVASRSAAWPDHPRFKAHVVASFNYADFDPNVKTTITVFPAYGRESSFVVDFSQIQ